MTLHDRLTPLTLAATLDRLPAPTSDWDSRVTLGIGPDAVTLARLADGGDALGHLVALKRGQAKGGDDKLGAAYLIGELGWEIGRLLGGLWLAGWSVGSVSAEAIAVSVRAVAWEEDGESGIVQTLDLSLEPEGFIAGPANPGALARAMEVLHGGIIAQLARSTRLGQAAQWRLVGDGLSSALLHQGRALDRLHDAMALGRTILADRSTRLHSLQTEYVEVTLPGVDTAAPPGAQNWFRLRGGCCRFYTAKEESGEYCTTCVLRERNDQIARLRRYLERRLAQANQVAK